MHAIYTITFYQLENEINDSATNHVPESSLRKEMRKTESIASLQNITNKASFAHISRFIEYKIQNK